MTRRTKNALGWMACTAIVFAGLSMAVVVLFLMLIHPKYIIPAVCILVSLGYSLLMGRAFAEDLGWIKNKDDK